MIHKDCPGDLTTFDYDGAGRLTRDGAKRLAYDGYDQLTRVQGAGGAELVTHAYGYDGQRTYTKGGGSEQFWFSPEYTLVKGARTERWHYVSIGDRLVARLTMSASSATVAGFLRPAPVITGVAVERTLFAAVLIGGAVLFVVVVMTGGRPVRAGVAVLAVCALAVAPMGCGGEEQLQRGLEVREGRLYFHQTVAAGPSLISGVAGIIRDERRFEPFGHPIESDFGLDPFNSLNKATDRQTGWSYHGARWMGPQTARWLTPDPPGKAPNPQFASTPWDLHPYQYGRQNPSLYWDPDGQAVELDSTLGHHIVPESVTAGLVRDHRLSSEAARVFRTSVTGWGKGLDSHEFNRGHKQYNQAVRGEFDDAVKKGLDPRKMTAAQAESFVTRIRTSRNPIFKQFLEVQLKVVDMVRDGRTRAEINRFIQAAQGALTREGGFIRFGQAFKQTLGRIVGRLGMFVNVTGAVSEYMEDRDMTNAGFVRTPVEGSEMAFPIIFKWAPKEWTDAQAGGTI